MKLIDAEEKPDFEWQKSAFSLWDKTGRKGIIRAVPGSGKTRAGIRIIQGLREENPVAKIWIASPNRQIIRQWNVELTKSGIAGVKVRTYFKLLKFFQEGDSPDLLILDECHSTLSQVRGRVLMYKPKYLLGLSATPEESEEIIGPIFLDISWEKANVSPFKLIYVLFGLDMLESMKYQQLTDEVRRVLKNNDEDNGRYNPYTMVVIMKRRSYVYELPKRIEIARDIVKKHMSERVMIFSERLSQISSLKGALKADEIECSLCTSQEDKLDDFLSKKTNVLISSKMVREGFDDPSVSVGLVMSTPLTARNQVQTLGRIVRQMQGKFATVYWILAKQTTDEKLMLQGAVRDFQVIDADTGLSWDLESLAPGSKYLCGYMGKEYGVFPSGDLFIPDGKERRLVCTENVSINEAAQLVIKLKGGGRFVITANGRMLTRVGSDVYYLGRTEGVISFEAV